MRSRFSPAFALDDQAPRSTKARHVIPAASRKRRTRSRQQLSFFARLEDDTDIIDDWEQKMLHYTKRNWFACISY